VASCPPYGEGAPARQRRASASPAAARDVQLGRWRAADIFVIRAQAGPRWRKPRLGGGAGPLLREPLSKSREEKIKLLANALNTAAGSCFTVGIVAPSVAVLINLGDAQDKVTPRILALNVLGWLCAALVLHMFARKQLDKLDQ
jgi:hypothetical protein